MASDSDDQSRSAKKGDAFFTLAPEDLENEEELQTLCDLPNTAAEALQDEHDARSGVTDESVMLGEPSAGGPRN